MKKRFWTLFIITICALMLGVAALLSGCNDTAGGEKADYSVTVLSPAEQPLSDITVSWMTGSTKAGSAKTDAEGKATASLTVGTYSISLAGYGEGLEYDTVSVSSAMRNVTLQLSVMKVNYTVSVKDKTGAPAANVSVSWTKDGKIAGTARTGADGKAAKELDYGEYSVILSNIPEGNVYDGAKTVTGKNPAADFELRVGETKTYTVKVRSEGGLVFKEQSLFVDKGETRVASGWTDENGEFTFVLEPGSYTVYPAIIQDGYSCDPLNLTADVTGGELILRSEVITSAPLAGQRYVMGDIIHNYSFTTPYELNGSVWNKTVAEILADKEVLLINNWGTGCTYCVQEMPAMQEIYEKYSNKIEIVAVSNYTNPIDTDSAIINYYAKNGYTFPMMRDTNGFATKFGLTAWPTTVVIDRYGAIARIEVGAVTSSEVFERLILKYIGEDYVQTFIPGESESESITNEMAKPDVEIAADHYEKIAQAMNGTGVNIEWFGETQYEYAWPFVLGTDKDVSPDKAVMYSSNTGKANSMSIIYANVNIDAGKVFTFDYYADTEEDDVFSIIWDGKIIKEIAGYSKGWQTCYLYTDLISGNHSLSMTYIKDSQKNGGKDNVYLRNVRYSDIADITDPTDMLRCAAYGTPAAGDSVFPYYAKVELKSDGYYHVIRDELENKQYAGNDESPLLLVNLLNATSWLNELSLYQLVYGINANTNEYVFDCTFTIDGETRDYREDFLQYFKAATASDVPDHVPVDSYLHDLLVALMQKFDQMCGESYHENEWLEACYFYSHYGSGSPIGNPVLGLMKKTAIPVTEGKTYTADLTRNMQPFPTVIYTFTPTADAVYKIESLISDDDADRYSAQVWLYDDDTDPDSAIIESGSLRVNRGKVNEQNFEIYRYMKAGHKYYIEVAFLMSETGQLDFKISNVGQSVTVLTPCCYDVYDMVLDESGKETGEIVVSGAVDYVKDEDGYFHAKNPDGTTGDFIYLDVINADTGVLGTIPLTRLIDYYVDDPADYSKLDYKMFDFRYCVMYYNTVDSEGNEIVNYNPKVEIASADHPEYKDYTEILRTYIESAPTEGEYKGLIKVNQELVDILSLFLEIRVNGIYAEIKNGVNVYSIESALENEWLKFCWYNRTYNENNP